MLEPAERVSVPPTCGPRRATALQRAVAAGAWFSLAAGMLVLMADADRSPAIAAAPAPPTAVPFVGQALAVTDVSTQLFDASDLERVVVGLAPGTGLHVAGYVETAAGLWHRRVLWVRVGDGVDAATGFVPADAVTLTAGDAPRLDLTASTSGDDAAGPAEKGSAGADAPAAALGIRWLPDTVVRWSEPIVRAAFRHGVDPDLVTIVVLVESGGNPEAVSPSGAVGLMQIMPATAADIAATRGIADHSVDALRDPEYNIDFGTWYLAAMLRAFGHAEDPDWQQSVELAAAAYNGGPGTVRQFLDGAGSLPAESRGYRHWVGSMWSERAAPESAGYDAWLAAGGERLVRLAGPGLEESAASSLPPTP